MTRSCSKDSWAFLKNTGPISRLHVGTCTTGFLSLRLSDSLQNCLTRHQHLQAWGACIGSSILKRKQPRNVRKEFTVALWKHLRRTGYDGIIKDTAGPCSLAIILELAAKTACLQRATQIHCCKVFWKMRRRKAHVTESSLSATA